MIPFISSGHFRNGYKVNILACTAGKVFRVRKEITRYLIDPNRHQFKKLVNAEINMKKS